MTDEKKMTMKEAKQWMIEHYGIDDDGTKQSEVTRFVIRSLEAWVELKSELMKPQYKYGIGRNTVLVFIENAIGEVGENNDTSADG